MQKHQNSNEVHCVVYNNTDPEEKGCWGNFKIVGGAKIAVINPDHNEEFYFRHLIKTIS